MIAIPDEIRALREKLQFVESERDILKSNITEITQEAIKIQNNQQNQLQGSMAVSGIT